MTQLDLICTEPYMIGMLGVFTFVSIALGSLLFSNISDFKGRKPVVVMSSLVTPLGLLSLKFFNYNLHVVYAIIFSFGLTYNPRSCIAYLLASEFLETKDKLFMGIATWPFSGCLMILTVIFFMYVSKDQEAYFTWIIILMFLAIWFVYTCLPESPPYLYETRKFEELQNCL